MFDEPEEQRTEEAATAAERAKEKSDEFRMHAELVAVFEGVRKYDAEIDDALNADLALDLQKTIGKMEKSRSPESPLLPAEAIGDAAKALDLPASAGLTTNDYHVRRRPGEVVIARWLAGEQVETFYTRLQAHFDAALNGYRQEERQAKEWKQDPTTIAYLDALDAVEVKMADRYLRPIMRAHGAFVLSTQAADEMDILHLCDFVMGVGAERIVGETSVPADESIESERAWYFKLFSLRGMKEKEERMCFFTYLQKADDSGDW